MAASKLHKRIRIFLATFWLVAFSWLFYSMQARGFDQSVLESTSEVHVQTSDETIRFTPTPDTKLAGLIFYPGALVDPDAYAPMARAIADAGYKVVIVKVPFRMTLLERHWREVMTRTETVISDDPSRTAWVIGGHSRGGKMAALLAKEHPEMLAGLVLVGTSHPRVDNLSHLKLDVMKVYGSEDGLASEREVKEFAGNLPAGTQWVRVEGGNHSQFGWYGWQLGDESAKIDRNTQQQITVRAMLEQLSRVARGLTVIPSSP